jgi:hypothetical protein
MWIATVISHEVNFALDSIAVLCAVKYIFKRIIIGGKNMIKNSKPVACMSGYTLSTTRSWCICTHGMYVYIIYIYIYPLRCSILGIPTNTRICVYIYIYVIRLPEESRWKKRRVSEPATILYYMYYVRCALSVGKLRRRRWEDSRRRVPVPDEGRGHYRGRERGFLLSSGITPQPVSKPTLSGTRHSILDLQRTRTSVF